MRGLGEAGVDHSAQNSGEDQSGGWRPVWGSRGRGRRVQTSRPDSAGGEEAEDAADLPVRFDLTGVHRIDGGELDNSGDGELGLGKKRERERGEQGGKGAGELPGRLGVVLTSSTAGEGTGRVRHGHGMAPVAMVGTVEEEGKGFCENPPVSSF